jgi:hypothetical protein
MRAGAKRTGDTAAWPGLRMYLSCLLAGVVLMGAGLCVEPQNAAARPGYSVYPASKYRAFSVHGTHGSDVFVSVGPGGLVEVSVFQLRNSGLVEYAVRGSYEDDQVKARLPGLGRIRMRWKPSGKPEVTDEPQGDCEGRKALIQEGIFAGIFSFRGERSYTEAKVKRVAGRTIQTFREVCKGPDAGPQPSTSSEEILNAYNRGSGTGVIGFEAWSKEEWGSRIEGFEAVLIERRRGLQIRRFTFAGGEPVAGQFMFDNRARSAFVAPPSPFQGSAELTNSTSGLWTGNLSVSFLGVGRVPLAGPGFKGELTHRGDALSPLGA